MPSPASSSGSYSPKPPPVRNNRKSLIPRPPNAFILFRVEHQPIVRHQNPTATVQQISVLLGKLWREQSPEVRRKYAEMAIIAKEDHKRKYPDYKFRPRPSKKATQELLTRQISKRKPKSPLLLQRSFTYPDFTIPNNEDILPVIIMDSSHSISPADLYGGPFLGLELADDLLMTPYDQLFSMNDPSPYPFNAEADSAFLDMLKFTSERV